MSQFLDELARSLAEPMPRGRAIRILAGATAAVVLPAWRAPGALGQSRSLRRTTCDQHCPSPHEKVCNCHVVPPSSTNPLGTCFHCCCPEDYECLCPEKECSCRPCPHAQKCGRKCCDKEKEERCADASRSLCCKPSEDECFSLTPGSPGKCCDREKEYCVTGKHTTCCPKPGKPCGRPGAHKCCPSPKVCDHGTCKCTEGTTPCGATCCERGETCIGGTCCPSGAVATRGNTKFCCPPGTVASGDQCCPPGQPNCCELPCLPPTQCVDGKCVRV